VAPVLVLEVAPVQVLVEAVGPVLERASAAAVVVEELERMDQRGFLNPKEQHCNYILLPPLVVLHPTDLTAE
jgi:hypothetical protein